MIIRCWGARGSLPVSGGEYLTYGGSTTCMELRSRDDDILIVDAGSGIRKLGLKLLHEHRYEYTMLFTHAHWDHLMGFPFFLPIYRKKTCIDVIGCTAAQKSIRDIVSNTMAAPYFPVDFSLVQSSLDFRGECAESFSVGPIEIHKIPLSHPNGGLGYRFIEDGKSFVFLTDNEPAHPHQDGLPAQAYVEFARGADFLIHDAEYRPEEYKNAKGWGHSTYTDALDIALKAGAKRFCLFHHNVERTDADLNAIVEDCQRRIREAGSGMTVEAATENLEIVL